MFLNITDRNIMLKVTIYTGTYGNGVTKTGEACSAAYLTRPNFGEARASELQWFRCPCHVKEKFSILVTERWARG